MLQVESISAGYGSITVLRNVSLVVKEREIVGVIGANGAGKTTLGRCISRTLPINSGKIIFDNREIQHLSSDRVVNSFRIIHVPEGRHIYAPFSVDENLILGCYSRYEKLGRRGREKLLSGCFNLFPILLERRKQLAGSLSGGEQQMLAIARGLMGEPRLMLVDEPSLGLAPLVFVTLCGAFKRINGEGVTLLLIEQNARAALNLSNRIYVFANGQVVACGASQEFTTDRLRELYMS